MKKKEKNLDETHGSEWAKQLAMQLLPHLLPAAHPNKR